MHRLAITVRRYLYWGPDVSRLGRWRKWPVVRYSGVIRLLAASWADLLVNSTIIAGVFTGLFCRSHVVLLR